MLWNRELEDVTAKMKSIKDSYDGHQSWTEDDLERFRGLKARKLELKGLLGIQT